MTQIDNPSVRDLIQSGYAGKPNEALKSAGLIIDPHLSNDNQQVYYRPADQQLFINISGTHNLSDVGTDAYLAFGNLKGTKRYKQARRVVRDAKIKYGVNYANISGHSLGGAIAQYVGAKNDKIITYNKGATIGQKTRHNESAYRTLLDPVSLFARSTKSVGLGSLFNAHSSKYLPKKVTFH